IAVEQLEGKSSLPLLLYFFDTAEHLFGPQLERGLIVIRLGLVRGQQGKLAFKNRIVVEIGEGNVMNIEILVRRYLVVQVEFALVKVVQVIRKVIPCGSIVRQMYLQALYHVIPKLIIVPDRKKSKPHPI